MAVVIRRMTLEDIAQVQQIDALSFSLPWPERSFHYELNQNPAARLWVAEDRTAQKTAKITGMIGIWVIVDEIHIATLAVHPDHRRQNIGKKLFLTALMSAYDEGAKKAFLEVRSSNTAAINLYQGMGFLTAGIRKRYYKDNNEDALLMNLDAIDPDHLKRLIK